jgi:hypothetical protein
LSPEGQLICSSGLTAAHLQRSLEHRLRVARERQVGLLPSVALAPCGQAQHFGLCCAQAAFASKHLGTSFPCLGMLVRMRNDTQQYVLCTDLHLVARNSKSSSVSELARCAQATPVIASRLVCSNMQAREACVGRAALRCGSHRQVQLALELQVLASRAQVPARSPAIVL